MGVRAPAARAQPLPGLPGDWRVITVPVMTTEGATPAAGLAGLFSSPDIEREDLPDGGFVLRSASRLAPYPDRLGSYLLHWAQEAPQRTFLAERRGEGWRRLSYGDALRQVRSAAQWLLDRGGDAERPVAVLSGNGINAAILTLASMHVGIPVSPISPAYSLQSGDFATLRHVLSILSPRVIYADVMAHFQPALDAIAVEDAVFLTDGADGCLPASTAEPTDEVEARFQAVGPDTVAKILFTSGSTGRPKGVINTHRMMLSNQQAIVQCWPFLARRPPILLDWLPWSHTFGANHNFNMVLRHGGTLYIDDGKPAAGLIERTLRNLRDISPTAYFNVPRGYDILLPYLEADPGLAQGLASKLDIAFYAGAALPQETYRRLHGVLAGARDMPVPIISAWGATETAPMATCVHYPITDARNIGVPAPGTEIRFLPAMEKLEMRVRGPNVTPGYWRDEPQTRDAFDTDGFYRIGDAGRLADPDDPNQGIVFDGRTAENFKLTSGTWVHVGILRTAILGALSLLAGDVVVTGPDRAELGILIFPPLGTDADREALSGRIAAYNAENPGSSRRIARALVLATGPDIDANEITDKGYINQRAVLTNRKQAVDALYNGADGTMIFPASE